jgi:hypothetical protein
VQYCTTSVDLLPSHSSLGSKAPSYASHCRLQRMLTPAAYCCALLVDFLCLLHTAAKHAALWSQQDAAGAAQPQPLDI